MEKKVIGTATILVLCILLLPTGVNAQQDVDHFTNISYNTGDNVLEIRNETWGNQWQKHCFVNLTQDTHYLIHIQINNGLGWRTLLTLYAFGEHHNLEFISNTNDTYLIFIPKNSTQYRLTFSRSQYDTFRFNITITEIWPVSVPITVTEVVTQWNTTTVTEIIYLDRYLPFFGDPSIWLPLTSIIFLVGVVIVWTMWKKNMSPPINSNTSSDLLREIFDGM